MPVLILDAVEDSFDSLGRPLGDLMHEMTRRSYYHFSRSVSWQPSVNVYEDERHFFICAELAGLDKKQIHVDVVGNKVVIKGDRAAPPPPKTDGNSAILRMEIAYGAFERTIELPTSANMDKVGARLVDGFLWVTVEKHG